MSLESREIHIFPEMKTAQFTYLGVLCDDGCTITLDKKNMKVQNNEQQILTGHRNKQTIMWEVSFTKTQNKEQTKSIVKNILAQVNKPELSSYYYLSCCTV